MLPVEFLKKALQPLPRKVRPFSLLAGHVVVDEAAADLWIKNIVVQASLEYSVPEMNADNVALPGIGHLEPLGFPLLVPSILKLSFKQKILINIVQKILSGRILP